MDEAVGRARAALAAGQAAEGVVDRFESALRAAFWAGRAVLASRGVLAGSTPGDVWRQVVVVLPQLAEWAGCFDHAGAKLLGAAQRRYQLREREADDLLRDAQTFVDLCQRMNGRIASRGRVAG